MAIDAKIIAYNGIPEKIRTITLADGSKMYSTEDDGVVGYHEHYDYKNFDDFIVNYARRYQAI